MGPAGLEGARAVHITTTVDLSCVCTTTHSNTTNGCAESLASWAAQSHDSVMPAVRHDAACPADTADATVVAAAAPDDAASATLYSNCRQSSTSLPSLPPRRPCDELCSERLPLVHVASASESSLVCDAGAATAAALPAAAPLAALAVAPFATARDAAAPSHVLQIVHFSLPACPPAAIDRIDLFPFWNASTTIHVGQSPSARFSLSSSAVSSPGGSLAIAHTVCATTSTTAAICHSRSMPVRPPPLQCAPDASGTGSILTSGLFPAPAPAPPSAVATPSDEYSFISVDNTTLPAKSSVVDTSTSTGFVVAIILISVGCLLCFIQHINRSDRARAAARAAASVHPGGDINDGDDDDSLAGLPTYSPTCDSLSPPSPSATAAPPTLACNAITVIPPSYEHAVIVPPPLSLPTLVPMTPPPVYTRDSSLEPPPPILILG